MVCQELKTELAPEGFNKLSEDTVSPSDTDSQKLQQLFEEKDETALAQELMRPGMTPGAAAYFLDSVIGDTEDATEVCCWGIVAVTGIQ